MLGPDGDAALALQVVAVHHPLFDALVVAEDVGLTEDRVDQGGLAVIDVGDDGHIADVAGPDRAAVAGDMNPLVPTWVGAEHCSRRRTRDYSAQQRNRRNLSARVSVLV